jgi:hypothetical protein
MGWHAPLDVLSHRGKAIEIMIDDSKMDGNYIRLIALSAC